MLSFLTHLVTVQKHVFTTSVLLLCSAVPAPRRHFHQLKLHTITLLRGSSFKSNQIKFIHHTQYTKAKYTVYSQCGATGSSQRPNAPLMGHPVTKAIRTESNATHEIKNYYQDTQAA